MTGGFRRHAALAGTSPACPIFSHAPRSSKAFTSLVSYRREFVAFRALSLARFQSLGGWARSPHRAHSSPPRCTRAAGRFAFRETRVEPVSAATTSIESSGLTFAELQGT